MLRAIGIENFKAIGEATRFALSDITLLYGQNSAGKSSVIHALRYAYEVLVNDNLDPVVSNIDGVDVYLGGFRNLVHRRDLTRDISLAFRYDIEMQGRSADYEQFCRSVTANSDFLPNFEKYFQSLVSATPSAFDNAIPARFFPEHFQCGFVQFMKKPSTFTLYLRVGWSIEYRRPFIKQLHVKVDNTPFIAQVGNVAVFNQEALDFAPDYDFNFNQLYESTDLEVIRKIQHQLPPDARLYHQVGDWDWEPDLSGMDFEPVEGSNVRSDSNNSEEENSLAEDIEAAQNRWGDIKAEAIAATNSMSKPWKEHARELLSCSEEQGWRFPWWGETFRTSWDSDHGLLAMHEMQQLREQVGGSEDDELWREQYQSFNHALCFIATTAVVARANLCALLKNIIHLGPLREHQTKVQLLDSTQKRGWYFGANSWLQLAESEHILESTSKWLFDSDKFDTGYRLENVRSKLISNPASFIEQIKSDPNLVDKLIDDAIEKREIVILDRFGLKLTTIEIGTGISQIIPLIVAAEQIFLETVIVEQPELHLHPRSELVIGDLLISNIKGARRSGGRQFIVETHSEHIALRLLRRIRETHDDEMVGSLCLKPEQLSVNYAEPTDVGMKIHHLRVDETGEFIDRWPKGFFDERAEELF